MSKNCMRCVRAERTGPDLLCDKCRGESELMEHLRDLGKRYEDAIRQSNDLRAPAYGGIPVGGAHVDPLMRAAGLEEFMRAVRAGAEPDKALSDAKERAASVADLWNRGREYQVHRWRNGADSYLESVTAGARALMPLGKSAMPYPRMIRISDVAYCNNCDMPFTWLGGLPGEVALWCPKCLGLTQEEYDKRKVGTGNAQA
jgi:hypothetical protein